MAALRLPTRLSPLDFILLVTFVVNLIALHSVAQSPVLTDWTTEAECSYPTSVFFDEKQNVILATCRDSAIIAIQLPQRTITTLITVDDCWWPQMLTGDANEGIAFAACFNSGTPPGDPSKAASSVMLSGPGYANVSMFTSFTECNWVGGFAWDRDAEIKNSNSQPPVYMTCDNVPTLIAKSSGSNNTIVPLVNNSVNCAFSSIGFSGGFIYTSCGFTFVEYTPYWVVSLDVQSRELNLLIQGTEPGFSTVAIAVAPTCNSQAIKVVYGDNEVTSTLVDNGRIVNITNLTNTDQCTSPLSISFQTNAGGCDSSNEVFVACAAYGDSVISADLMHPGSVAVAIPFEQCANPFWTYWHNPSACLFAACASGSVISLCNFTSLNEPRDIGGI